MRRVLGRVGEALSQYTGPLTPLGLLSYRPGPLSLPSTSVRVPGYLAQLQYNVYRTQFSSHTHGNDQDDNDDDDADTDESPSLSAASLDENLFQLSPALEERLQGLHHVRMCAHNSIHLRR